MITRLDAGAALHRCEALLTSSSVMAEVTYSSARRRLWRCSACAYWPRLRA